jgi:hypothetical protein
MRRQNRIPFDRHALAMLLGAFVFACALAQRRLTKRSREFSIYALR